MSTGANAGMAFYQDAGCTNAITPQASGTFNFHGSVYAPTATVNFQSSGGVTIDAHLVVSEIKFQSSATLTVNYHLDNAAQTGLPTLVE